MSNFTTERGFLFPSFDPLEEEGERIRRFMLFLESSGVGAIISRYVKNESGRGGRPSVNYHRLFAAVTKAAAAEMGIPFDDGLLQNRRIRRGDRVPRRQTGEEDGRRGAPPEKGGRRVLRRRRLLRLPFPRLLLPFRQGRRGRGQENVRGQPRLLGDEGRSREEPPLAQGDRAPGQSERPGRGGVRGGQGRLRIRQAEAPRDEKGLDGNHAQRAGDDDRQTVPLLRNRRRPRLLAGSPGSRPPRIQEALRKAIVKKGQKDTRKNI